MQNWFSVLCQFTLISIRVHMENSKEPYQFLVLLVNCRILYNCVSKYDRTTYHNKGDIFQKYSCFLSEWQKLHRGQYHFHTVQNQTNVNRKIYMSAFMVKLLVKKKGKQ